MGMKQIRKAYMKSAKECHPDLQEETHERVTKDTKFKTAKPSIRQKEEEEGGQRKKPKKRTSNFVQVTDAYEYLKSILENKYPHHSSSTNEIATEAEEIAF